MVSGPVTDGKQGCLRVNIPEVAFNRSCIDDKPVPPCFVLLETDYQRFRTQQTAQSDTTWKRSWAAETAEIPIKHTNDKRIRFIVIANGAEKQEPLGIGDVEIDFLTSQERTERWITLKDVGTQGFKVSYLRFRSVWAPSASNREAPPSMPWDGPVLFLDGTEDANLTTMIKQRGKSVFNEPQIAPQFVYRPKV